MNKSRLLITLALVVSLATAALLPVAAQDDTDAPPPEERPTLGLAFSENNGEAQVTQVVAGGPADNAGIITDDIITAVDGETVNADTLAPTIWSYDPGDTITLTVTRGEETLDLNVTLGEPDLRRERERDGWRGPNLPDFPGMQQAFLGIGLDSEADNAVIAEVTEGSAAEDAGLLVGDVITAIDDTAVTTAAEVVAAISTYAPDDTITITVERDGETLEIETTLAARGNRFETQPLRPMISGGFDYLEDENAWEVVEIIPDSTAAETVLEVGDRITAIDGEAFSEDMRMGRLQIDPTNTVTLTIERGDGTLDIEVPSVLLLELLISTRQPFSFGQIPDDFDFNSPDFGFRGDPPLDFEFDGPRLGNRVQLGVAFTTLDADIAAENDLDVTEGALVTNILAGSPAEDAGL